MSKSRGNVIAPDLLVERYGADAVRAFLMFFARWEMGAPWNSSGIDGTVRWLRRVWATVTETASTKPAKKSHGVSKTDAPGDHNANSLRTDTAAGDQAKRALRRKVHQTLKQVTRDFETFEFNTTVSGLMELLNEMTRAKEAGVVGTPEWAEAVDIYVRMLAPICPHIAEELWSARLGKPYSVHTQPWPKVDEVAAQEDEITIPVQVNGKLRDRVSVPADATEEQIKTAALASVGVQKYLEGKTPKKVIVAQKKLVSIVV
jgi:leucyl-tRNA synthetase